MERGKRGLITVELRVKVRDKDGKLVAVRRKKSALILNNFRDLLAHLFYPEETIAATNKRRITLVNLGGSSVGINVRSATGSAAGYGLCWQTVENVDMKVGVRIRIGTSTVSPARTDYKLGAEVANEVPSQTVGADYISWAVSIVLAAAADIAEAGLSMRAQTATVAAAAYDNFLLFRDTFTPISVPAGGTISITYTLTL